MPLFWSSENRIIPLYIIFASNRKSSGNVSLDEARSRVDTEPHHGNTFECKRSQKKLIGLENKGYHYAMAIRETKKCSAPSNRWDIQEVCGFMPLLHGYLYQHGNYSHAA